MLIGTGSEVSVCVEAQKTLSGSGVSARVVSMPCWELFELLSEDEQAAVLPPGVPTLAVEAATTLGWERFADDTIGLDRFGASAPGAAALENLGFTPRTSPTGPGPCWPRGGAPASVPRPARGRHR